MVEASLRLEGVGDDSDNVVCITSETDGLLAESGGTDFGGDSPA